VARRVIQFPVRNAFAPRSYDALARDTEDTLHHAHRIVQQVEDEIARTADRMSSGRSAEFERARAGIIMLRPLTRWGRLRKQIAPLFTKARTYAASLFNHG
jgi:hypothetical protein